MSIESASTHSHYVGHATYELPLAPPDKDLHVRRLRLHKFLRDRLIRGEVAKRLDYLMHLRIT